MIRHVCPICEAPFRSTDAFESHLEDHSIEESGEVEDAHSMTVAAPFCTQKGLEWQKYGPHSAANAERAGAHPTQPEELDPC